MAKSGDVIENPVSGERVTFHQTAAETGGELLRWEHALRPGARVPYDHIHSVQEERFEVVAGTATVRIGNDTKVFTVGDTLVIPAGTAHGLANLGDDELRVLTELRAAMNTEVYFETVFGLARDGKVAKNWQKDTQGATYYDNCRAPIEFAERAMKLASAASAM